MDVLPPHCQHLHTQPHSLEELVVASLCPIASTAGLGLNPSPQLFLKTAKVLLLPSADVQIQLLHPRSCHATTQLMIPVALLRLVVHCHNFLSWICIKPANSEVEQPAPNQQSHDDLAIMVKFGGLWQEINMCLAAIALD